MQYALTKNKMIIIVAKHGRRHPCRGPLQSPISTIALGLHDFVFEIIARTGQH